jgi:hypothetical protein
MRVNPREAAVSTSVAVRRLPDPLGPLVCFESFDEVEAASVAQPQNPVAINAPMATVLSR